MYLARQRVASFVMRDLVQGGDFLAVTIASADALGTSVDAPFLRFL